MQMQHIHQTPYMNPGFSRPASITLLRTAGYQHNLCVYVRKSQRAGFVTYAQCRVSRNIAASGDGRAHSIKEGGVTS
ncbi:hypothetical protein I7I50_09811 [Histoplasma capsulatum G186AR]|uniref:Uncharacterized protein n=1 Tax=Ajellomyces capsulatus TaxID=5037 RepID=A0A8H7Z1V1_AJECA|nr:hypothetical protein I7I52_10872 [Histoplasma capsulatum]QSS68744.1 hypothetical protein I7I50_09811 [Histoplasma capsulatum G186AR]